MLTHLLIKNYALIKSLEIKPSKDLNIITGETGAGKSIMLGAIGLLLGNRADSKALFNEEEKCVIEGTFSIKSYNLEHLFNEENIEFDDECIIRREISPAGKSRAFINDSPVNLDILKKWGSALIDIHSQHETLLLGQANFQTTVIDGYAKNEKLVKEFQNLYQVYKATHGELTQLKSTAAEQKKQLDYFTFLFHELEEASLIADEQSVLEESLKLLENAELIKSKLNHATETLSGNVDNILSRLQDTKKQLEQISNISTNFETLKNRINSTIIELKDIAAEIDTENDKTDFNPTAIEKTQERLSLIYTLQKKHQVQTIEQLLELQDELKTKIDISLNADESILALQKKLEVLHKEVMACAQKLSEKRKGIQQALKKELESLLNEVGMPNATVSISIENSELSATGIDRIALLFSANKGLPPQELKNAASGGEFSRLMLCIKYILADKTALPTIIFDEIDTGISGEVALKVGNMMKQMANNHQVISITHLPQIAAKGDTHYYVFKDNTSEKTVSKMKLLTQDERIKEIAEMIGGNNPSKTVLQNAKELLNQ